MFILLILLYNKMSSQYSSISNFGPNTQTAVNNPLTYCMGTRDTEKRFLHGSSTTDIIGQDSEQCQRYMSEYCANTWDKFCEASSQSTGGYFPNNIQPCNSIGDAVCKNMTAGEMMIRNTASKKYLTEMLNCKKVFEPFDPNVANSPMVSYFVNDCSYGNGSCVPIYEVDPTAIDQDPVMNKILAKPTIAADILINIYNTAKRKKTLQRLNGTRLGHLFANAPYFKNLGGM
jgi:uncharacterized CHY-type Zn-finger protein